MHHLHLYARNSIGQCDNVICWPANASGCRFSRRREDRQPVIRLRSQASALRAIAHNDHIPHPATQCHVIASATMHHAARTTLRGHLSVFSHVHACARATPWGAISEHKITWSVISVCPHQKLFRATLPAIISKQDDEMISTITLSFA